MEEKRNGCVYFFKHNRLEPVKIGYSEHESPILRFRAFQTYAPYGGELLGFIITPEANELERTLHKKYSARRIWGEWFQLSIEEVKSIIELYTSIEEAKRKNNFYIRYAEKVDEFEQKREKEKYQLTNEELKELIDTMMHKGKLYEHGKIVNISEFARRHKTYRRRIYRLMGVSL
jgi:hypothetical protein